MRAQRPQAYAHSCTFMFMFMSVGGDGSPGGGAYADIYLFIYYKRSYNTYILQEESANKIITKIKKYDNAKCEIKSHTSSYANMLPSEKLISDSSSRTEISQWHYAYHWHQHHADNYYTELYYGYQRSTGKIRKVPVEP